MWRQVSLRLKADFQITRLQTFISRFQRALKALRWKELCAPSMGANLWGESPLWENRIELIASNLNH